MRPNYVYFWCKPGYRLDKKDKILKPFVSFLELNGIDYTCAKDCVYIKEDIFGENKNFILLLFNDIFQKYKSLDNVESKQVDGFLIGRYQQLNYE